MSTRRSIDRLSGRARKPKSAQDRADVDIQATAGNSPGTAGALPSANVANDARSGGPDARQGSLAHVPRGCAYGLLRFQPIALL